MSFLNSFPSFSFIASSLIIDPDKSISSALEQASITPLDLLPFPTNAFFFSPAFHHASALATKDSLSHELPREEECSC